MREALLQGLAAGLWILAGLAFLISALFPGSAGAKFLAPLLLAVAVFITAVGTSSGKPQQTRPALPVSFGTHILLLVVTAFLSSGVATIIVHEGDRRSFLYVAVSVIAALLLSSGLYVAKGGREKSWLRSRDAGHR